MKNKNLTPLFTVIIPAKDRSYYLEQTLRTCSLQDYQNLEIIVSDDGSVDDTRNIVEEAAKRDGRIRYVTPGNNVGMRDNFEFALSQVKPGYVLALGADDGLLPYGISSMNQLLQLTGKKMLAWQAPLFTYPGINSDSGQLALYARRGRIQRGVKIIKSREFLQRQVKCLHYLSDVESPMFYVKGVVSTELIDRVKNRSSEGRFYVCSTPDGYSGIVLAGEVDDYAFSYEPFSIYGLSPSSQGQNYLSGKEEAKKNSELFFKNSAAVPMHRDLASQPYSPLITLMTVDYLLTARDLSGWAELPININYRDVIVKSIAELTNGLWSQEKVSRELKILHEIARHHNLETLFNETLGKATRDLRTPLTGNAINSKMIFIDATHLGVKNIFDAAYAAYSAHKIFPDVGLGLIKSFISNSFTYWRKGKKIGDKFPDRDKWGL